MRAVLLLASALAFGLAAPASAQGMAGMAGMAKPKPDAKPRKPAARSKKATRKPGMVRRAQKRTSEVPMEPATAPLAGKHTGTAPAMQGMDHSTMPGMGGMDEGAAKPAQGGIPAMDMSTVPSTADPDCPPEHAKMGHCTPKAGAADAIAAVGTSLPAGNAPAPAAPMDHYADRIYPPAEMARVREAMHRDQGAQKFAYLAFNLAEYQPRPGGDAFRWAGEGFYGGDINRLWVKSEGEGKFGGGVEKAEVQLLYSRAVDPYFNIQGGIRQDLGRQPRRTYATIGFEGLAPYWFEVEGALFLSDKGDLLGRVGGYYDQRITQRLILQPRVEFNLAAQDVPENGIGAGLSTAELGLRLRYEITRQFGPYVGVSWERKAGASARFARAAGEDPTSAGLVAGIRFWF